jgi:hypothetical protein
VIVAEELVTLTPVAFPPVVIVTSVESLVHVSPLVICDRLPSEYVPHAVNCCVALTSRLTLEGLIAIESIVGFVKNPRQLTPKASATRTVNASDNASLRPVNIDNRLR